MERKCMPVFLFAERQVLDMSVIISLHSSDGIVIGADRRTTVRENGVVRYSDETCKIFPFSEGIIIAHCGDNRMSRDLTVHDFFKESKTKISKSINFRFTDQIVILLYGLRI